MNDPQDWINSKFTVADLHGKLVDFVIHDGPHLHAGVGELIAVAKGNLMRVRIINQMEMAKDRSHVFGGAFCIFGSHADKLVRNPPGSKNPFSFKNS